MPLLEIKKYPEQSMEQTDIRQWLEGIGFGQYADSFEKAGITTELLPALAEKDLILINVQSEDDRKKLIELSGAVLFKFRYDLFYFILDSYSVDDKICGWCFEEFDFLEYAMDVLQESKNISLLDDPRHKIAFMRQFGLACLCMAKLIDKNNKIDMNPEVTIRRQLLYGILKILQSQDNVSKEFHEDMYRRAAAIQNYLASKYASFFINDLENTYKDGFHHLREFSRETRNIFLEVEKYINIDNVKESNRYKLKENEVWLMSLYIRILKLHKKINIANLIFFIVPLSVTIVSSYIFLRINIPIIRALSISTIISSCFLLLSQAVSFQYPWIPSPFFAGSAPMNIGKVIGIVSATIYYAAFNSKYYIFLISGVFLINPLYTIVISRWYMAREIYIIYLLWKEFKGDKLINENIPIILVINGDGFEQFRMQKSGWRIHRILRDAWNHGEVFFLFYISNWNNIKGWREYLIEKSDSILINSISTTSIMGDIVQPEGLTYQLFNKLEIFNLAYNTKGKIIFFQSDLDDKSDGYSDIDVLMLRSNIPVGYALLNRNPSENILIADTAKLIANSTAEVAYSDSRLSQQSSAVIHSLQHSGLRPVAQAYLRVRLANSNIERFLCLMDAIELLLRLSVFLLLTTLWTQKEYDAELEKKLCRASLGGWLEVLRQLLQKPVSPFGKALAAAWNEPLFSTAKQLISEINEAGLTTWKNSARTWLSWLDWFVFLRNKTRGHGLVDDNVIGNLWHLLHETFLDLVRNLDILTIRGKFVASEGREVKGWTRFCKKYKFPEKISVTDEKLKSLFFESEMQGGQRLRLHPFVLLYEESVLVWNSRKLMKKDQIYANSAEYINYNTGNIDMLFTGDVAFHALWENQEVETV